MSFRKKLLMLLFLPLLFSKNIVSQNLNSNIRKVTDIETSYPFWSPDETQIVFQSNRNDDDTELYVMNSDGKNIKRLTYAKGLDETPIWSPDGEKILFASNRDGNHEVYIMDANGKNQKNLTNHPSHDGHPNFSPDGKRIIFHSTRHMPDSTYKGNQFTRLINHELYEMDLDGKNVERITHFNGWDTYPDISPDGNKIAFRRRIDTDMGIHSSNSEVFIANRDGSNAYNLSKYPDHDGWPAWSPDGKRVAFASERERYDEWHIYIINIDGTEIKRITNFDNQGGYFSKPQWSKDGKRILCTRTKDGNVEIFIVEIPEND